MTKINLVVFEGIDACGKSTLMNKFHEYLTEKYPDRTVKEIITTDEIDGARSFLSMNTKMNTEIRELILKSLFISGMYNLTFNGKLREYFNSLHDGDFILMDRYFPSLVYNLSIKENVLVENLLKGMIPEHINTNIVFCKCNPKVTLKRMAARSGVTEYFESMKERQNMIASKYDYINDYHDFEERTSAESVGYNRIILDSENNNPDQLLDGLIHELIINKTLER